MKRNLIVLIAFVTNLLCGCKMETVANVGYNISNSLFNFFAGLLIFIISAFVLAAVWGVLFGKGKRSN